MLLDIRICLKDYFVRKVDTILFSLSIVEDVFIPTFDGSLRVSELFKRIRLRG